MTEVDKTILVLQPFRAEFDSAFDLVRRSAAAIGAQLLRIDEFAMAGSITEQIYEAIESSDLIICDVTHSNPNVMYQMGYAHALGRPVILISQHSERMPFDIRSVRVIYYDLDAGKAADFVQRLEVSIARALSDPDEFSTRPRTETSVSTVFVSYSHEDKIFLDRLRVHLRPLEKEGLIDLWDDTKLRAGDRWKASIEEALSRARVAILLVTADFLASEFIVNDELPPLLSKAESEGTRIVPVILKPCRFRRDKNLGPFQAHNDPSKPLVTLSAGEQEQVYDEISELVEQFMER